MAMRPALIAAMACFTLAGCQTAIAPVQVTRFHTAAPNADLERGVFQMAAPADSLDEATYQEAVARELQRLGYRDVRTAQPTGQAAGAPAPAALFIVTVSSKTEVQAGVKGRSPVSIGVGGGTGGYGGGVGVGLGFNLGGKPKDMIFTSLAVSIKRASDSKPIWEGRAETQAKAGTPGAQPGLAAAKLAASLFANYPGESGKTVTVP
jgi:hypothetical protein